MRDGDQQKLDALYHRGATTIYSARADQRFSYTLYVPTRVAVGPETRIIVSVHGTGRMQALYRDMFADFCEANNCIVIAPLFPADVLQDGELNGYKYIQEGSIRYDLVVLDIVAQVHERYAARADQILMFGFSGGGHFTHRFTLLHPDRILAASVGAPGSVTLLDFERPWWVGLSDAEARFGLAIDRSAFKGLPVHFVVGADDLETWEITFAEGDRRFMPGANDAGVNRPERIQSLARSFAHAGAEIQVDLVPGACHDVTQVIDRTLDFFAAALARKSRSGC